MHERSIITNFLLHLANHDLSKSMSDNHNPNQSAKKQEPNPDERPENENEDRTVEQDQLNYYNEYCRLYLANSVLSTQLKQLNTEKSDLLGKLTKLEKKADEIQEGQSGENQEKKRRVRRPASEISRHYKCSLQTCSKSYGSEGSLNQHLKIKHPQIFKNLNLNYASSNHTVKESQDNDQYSGEA